MSTLSDAPTGSPASGEFISVFPGPGFRFYAFLIFMSGCSLVQFAQGSWFFGVFAGAIAVIMLGLLWLRQKAASLRDNGYAALKAAAVAENGCAPDLSFLLSTGDALYIFVGPGRFYFGSATEPFDPGRLYGPNSVREWQVEWTTVVNHGSASSASQKQGFKLNVRMQSIDNPQIKIACDSEQMAYRLDEAFRRMLTIDAAGKIAAPDKTP